MATCNTNTLLASGNQFQMLGGGLSQVARLAMLKNILLAANPAADTSVNTLLEAGKCFSCLTAGQQRIVRLQLLCEISNAEGGGPVPMPTDMLLWLNPEGLAIYDNEELIPVWPDSSGNSNNANSGGADDPVVSIVDGHKVAFFEDDSTTRFFNVGATLFSGAGPRTVFGVYRRTVTMGFFGSVCGCGAQLNNQLSSLISRDDVDGGLCSPYHGSFATDFHGNKSTSGNVTYADAFNYNGTTLSVWRNGTEEASQAQVLATAATNFFIGANPGPNDLYQFGYIAEVIVWDRSLSVAEMAATFDYLNTKYGL